MNRPYVVVYTSDQFFPPPGVLFTVWIFYADTCNFFAKATPHKNERGLREFRRKKIVYVVVRVSIWDHFVFLAKVKPAN